MPRTLTQAWKVNPEFLEGKTFKQVIQMAGDGRLKDGNGTSTELREWLSVIPLERVRLCAEGCLSESFEDSGQALQDVVNEVGTRLGFEVKHGKYRGAKNAIGNDGLWFAQDGFGLVVEVKTTDAYRLNLDTVAEYQNKLAQEGMLDPANSSMLIVVGREDTGDLEAQIRGSRHAWTVRLISVESLLRLAEVKVELDDLVTMNKINRVLRPVEYTRLDEIVDLLFATKQDLETVESEPPPTLVENTPRTERAPRPGHETAREAAIKQIERRLGATFVRRGKTLRESSDGKTRLVCLAAQRTDKAGSSRYWYGFTPSHRKYIEGAAAAYVAFVCGDTGKTYLCPGDKVLGWLQCLSTSSMGPEGADKIHHWNFDLHDDGARVVLPKVGGGIAADLTAFLI